MALDPVLSHGLPPRTEMEVQAERCANASPKILSEARFIERNQIECSNDSLFVGRGPDLQRWHDLGSGARPANWAILRAIESQPTKTL